MTRHVMRASGDARSGRSASLVLTILALIVVGLAVPVSCDIAYPSSPAALSASARSRYTQLDVMRPSRTVTT